jgi:outer membrane protein assembly factor BamB
MDARHITMNRRNCGDNRSALALLLCTVVTLTGTASLAAPLEIGGPFEVDDQVVSDPAFDLPAPEFDSVGDRMIWQDRFGNLWVAAIDPATGNISPLNGRGFRVDTGLANVVEVGNTPRFTYGVEDVLVYTRKVDDKLWLAAARNFGPGVWVTELLGNGEDRYRIEGTPPEFEGVARMAYNRITETGDVVVSYRDWNDPASEGTADATGVGGRFLGAEPFLLTLRKDEFNVNQVFLIDLATGQGEVITNGPGNKLNPYIWFAPEFDSYAFVVLVDFLRLAVYRQENGAWSKFSEFTLPTDKPFLSSPEAFGHNGRSFISAVAAQELGDGTFPGQPVGPSEIWVTGIDPALPFARRIDDPTTEERRSEPEGYTLDGGVPVVYYTERPESPDGPDISLVRRASPGLGPDLVYDTPTASGGDWSGLHRDNRNTGRVPFPIADSFTAEPPVSLPSIQFIRSTLGVGGLLLTTSQNPGQGSQELVAYDTYSGAVRFRVGADVLGTRLTAAATLVDRDGNVYVVSNESAHKLSPDGVILWSTPVQGLSASPQFLSDGRLVLFTWNGWAYVLDPDDGAVVFSANLTPGRIFPEAPTCVSEDRPEDCAFVYAPAVDHDQDIVYVAFNRANGAGLLQAFDYSPQTGTLSNRWGRGSPRFALPISAPVLSADASRAYVQEVGGDLVSVSTVTRRQRWRQPVAATTDAPPVLSGNLLLLPGTASDGADAVSIVEDLGGGVVNRFTSVDYLPRSLPAAGPDGRFIVVVESVATGDLALAVVDATAGIVSLTPWTGGTPPNTLRSLVVRQDGTVFVQGWGLNSVFAFTPDP